MRTIRCDYSRLTEFEVDETVEELANGHDGEDDDDEIANGHFRSVTGDTRALSECEDEFEPSSVIKRVLCAGPDDVMRDEFQANLSDRRSTLVLELKEHTDGLTDCQLRLDQVTRAFQHKKNDLEQELDAISQNIYRVEYAVSTIDNGARELPPGPRCLQFMEGTTVTVLSTTVLILNCLIMVQCLTVTKCKQDAWWDHVFLLFYTAELVLRALLFREQLLVGPLTQVWSNWLDLIIVSLGVMDSWLIPLALEGRRMSGTIFGVPVMSLLRMLRLARLARVCKIARHIFFSDISWAEGEPFQVFMMLTIGISCLSMGLELDYKAWWAWSYLEQMILLIFIFELLLRLRMKGIRFFYKEDWAWNWLDFLIVSASMLDLWLIPLSAALAPNGEHHHFKHIMSHMKMLRMMRLLRILRLARLIKKIPQLYTLLMGIAEAMGSMAWVLLFTIVILYAFALVCLMLLRDGLAYQDGSPEAVQELFHSIDASMFILFLVMNGSVGILEPVFHSLPISKLVYMIFTVMSSWAILSILTAVVSDKMIEATDAHRAEMSKELGCDTINGRKVAFNRIFEKVDYDGDGTISKEELRQALDDDLSAAELSEATKMSIESMWQLFEIMEDKAGDIHREEFLEGMERDSGEMSERSIMRLEKRVKSVEHSVDELRDMMEESRDDIRMLVRQLVPGHTRAAPAPPAGRRSSVGQPLGNDQGSHFDNPPVSYGANRGARAERLSENHRNHHGHHHHHHRGGH